MVKQMQRLIDADAYSKKVCTYNETGCGSCKLQTKCPADEPTVDAVPVVRCKDCVYLGHRGATHFDGVNYGYLCSRTEDNEIELTDFCSMARRRDK